MNLFKNIFGKKQELPEVIVKETISQVTDGQQTAETPEETVRRLQDLLSDIVMFTRPRVVSSNFMTLFETVPEVFWPINYLAKRISDAHFDLKRASDKSIVLCNRLNVDMILKTPNPVMSWREVLYQHFVNKLVTGNAFMRAAMPDTMGPDTIKCQWCSNFWELPSDLVRVEPMEYSYGIPLFGIAKKEELIKGYRLSLGPYTGLMIPYHQVWHDRDGMPQFVNGQNFLRSKSRLQSVMKPVSNLIAVYEARNVIYVKRGGLGFIVAKKEDESGVIALDPDEKKEIEDVVVNKYGIGEGKQPFGVTSLPIDFVRINQSISDLQPFDETLEDAVKIAGAYDIPAVLVPRKDQSTFSNHASAEKSVYTSTIIPMTKRFCEELTLFLGLEQKGYFIDCDFSDVACLQEGRKESEETRKLILETGISAFNTGVKTLDDIRADLHETQLADSIPLFGKLKFQMTPEELETVNKIIKQSTSKGESNERDDEKPSVRDKGS